MQSNWEHFGLAFQCRLHHVSVQKFGVWIVQSKYSVWFTKVLQAYWMTTTFNHSLYFWTYLGCLKNCMANSYRHSSRSRVGQLAAKCFEKGTQKAYRNNRSWLNIWLIIGDFQCTAQKNILHFQKYNVTHTNISGRTKWRYQCPLFNIYQKCVTHNHVDSENLNWERQCIALL